MNRSVHASTRTPAITLLSPSHQLVNALSGALALVTTGIVLATLARAQTPTFNITVAKGTEWIQTSAADPVLDPRIPGPGYGGPHNFRIEIEARTGTLAGITAPVVTLPAGSLYPTFNPTRHNGGTLAYNSTEAWWAYGNDAGNYADLSRTQRDAQFAPGTYSFAILGQTRTVSFTATSFAPNAPKATLTGGSWRGGKYVIDTTQTLTITTNAFTHFDKNADGAIVIDVYEKNGPDVASNVVIRSANPTAPNTLSLSIPAGSLIAGRDYEIALLHWAAMDDPIQLSSGDIIGDLAVYEEATRITLSAVTAPSPTASASFYGVGDLPGGEVRSQIRDAVKTGGILYAVGSSTSREGSTSADTPFVWTSADGLTPLPDIVNRFTAAGALSASALTPDAAFIASQTRVGTGGTQQRGVRVTRPGLVNTDLGSLPTFTTSNALAISDTGSILYGTAVYTASTSVPIRNQAVRFTASPASITAIPFLNPGDDNSTPVGRGASSDGSVMVGRSTNGTVDAGATSPGGLGTGLGNQAFRYVHGSGVSAIPFLPGGTWSAAVAVSDDGNLTLVRGDSDSAPNGEFFLHNASAGTRTPLGTPNASRYPGGGGMSNDGSLVVATFNPADNPNIATYLRNAQGWHDLQTLVEQAGINLTGWNLRNGFVSGISGDGTLIWGNGLHNGVDEGYVIEFSPGYLAGYNTPASPPAAGAAIIGAWAIDGVPTSTRGASVIAFTGDGHYFAIATAATGPDEGPDNFERGRYTWNPSTGAITFSPVRDLNDNFFGSLEGAPAAAGTTFTVSGNTGTLTIPGDTPVTSQRITSATPLVGAFGRANIHDDSSLLIFLDNGYYFAASDGPTAPTTAAGRDGIEWGTYTWNPATGAFTATPIVNTDGSLGLSALTGTQTFTLSSDRLTLNGPGGLALPRIGPAPALTPATITLAGLAQTYDGSPRIVTATTSPAGLGVTLTYAGGTTPPTGAGSYSIAATITTTGYSGFTGGTLTVAPAAATVTLSGLSQNYDGGPKPVTVTTSPAGLATTLTYAGGATPPTEPGSYAISAAVTNPNYSGTATGSLVIGVSPAPLAPDAFAASVTGGGTAARVTVSTAAEFKARAESATAEVIEVSASLNLASLTPAGRVSVKSNKTILGRTADSTIIGQLELAGGVSNVALVGLHLTNPSGGSTVAINGATDVFIRHCTFFDAGGPLLAITGGATRVTVSWSEFYFSGGFSGTRSAVLIGAATGETTPLRVSLHHNWFSTGCGLSLPDGNLAYAHLYNNLYDLTGNTSGVQARAGAQFLVERNQFTDLANPLGKTGGGLIRSFGNTFTSTTGTPADPGADTVFNPGYGYELASPALLSALLKASAPAVGAGNQAGGSSRAATPFTATITGTPAAPVVPGTSFTLTAAPSGFTPTSYQ
jgi:pectate lyase